MRVGQIAGVDVVLNNWFLVLIVLFVFSGMADKVFLVFSAVIWHELAHMLAAGSLGYKVAEVELLPFGAVAKVEKLSTAGAGNELLIAAAGPLASFVLAFLSYVGAAEFALWRGVFLFYYQVNLTLALFNLLPALPLDGGRILRALLTMSSGKDYRQATRTVVLSGYGVSVLLLICSGAQYWIDSSINLTAIFASVFLYAASKTELDAARLRLMRHLAGKKAELCAKKIMPANHFTALRPVSLGEVIRLFRPAEYNIVLVLDENFKHSATFTETQIWEAAVEKGLSVEIGRI